MIPILNTNNKTEFELRVGRKFIYNPSSKISHISLYDANKQDANEIKFFIYDIYQKYYKAKIKVTFPFLMAIHDKNNSILSAVGFRLADKENLFLEQYLDDKIENIFTFKYGKNISRNSIVEIGSLASKGNGMSKFLFLAITAYLQKIGYFYAAITGTIKLRKSFQKLNLRPQIICNASKEKLIDKNEDWGSYYDYKPKIMIGNIQKSYQTLKTILNISVNQSLTKLYPYE